MENRFLFSLIGSAVLSFASCSKSSTTSLNLPPVEPPVTRNTPAQLLVTSQMELKGAGTSSSTELTAIKNSFFNKGPTNIKSILAQIDSRTAEYNKRSAEFPRTCLKDAAKEFSITSPIDLLLPQQLQCAEDVSSPNEAVRYQVSFGQKDGITYIRENQANGMASYVKIDEANTIDAWIIVADKDQVETSSQSLMHLASNESTKVLEFTVTGKGIGVGCGVQYRSNADYIYLKGIFSDTSCSGSATEVCLKASDLTQESDTSACVAAGLTTFSLQAVTPSTISYTRIHELGNQFTTGLTDTNAGK